MKRSICRFTPLLLTIGLLLPGSSPAQEYVVGDLLLRLPEGFRRISLDKETVPSPIPGAEPTTEHSARFRSENGSTLFLLSWRGVFPRDRGPMEAVWSRHVTVAGLPCELVRTSLFMGKKQKVHALFCPLDDRGGFLLYSPDLPPDRFRALLGGITLRKER
jgi:hypothetical protein